MAKKNSVTKILKQLGDNAVKAAKDSLAKGAESVVAEAKSRVPVKTGALRDSIQAEKVNADRFKITANAKSKKGVAYGRILEYSTKSNKAFLKPALDAKRAEIKQNLIKSVREAIRKK